MAAVDLYVLPHYWDSGYAEGELGLKPYASGASIDWWQHAHKKLVEERDEQLEQIGQALPAKVATVVAEVARQPQQDAPERALRAALRADRVRYRTEYAAALAAYTAIWQAFNTALARQQVREREDEDTAVTLLLLH
jgi:hypothetical protein